MAESFAFAITGQILCKLASLSFQEIGQIWGVKIEFNRLELTLSSIKAVLLDAAEQKKKSRQVEDWLEKLQDVLHDADDLLDDFMTENLRRKVVINGSTWNGISNFFSSSNPIALRVTMSQKLKHISKILEYIAADRRNFQLVELDHGIPVPYLFREQTHSDVNSSNVIGRDVDKNRIVDLLLCTNHNLDVLPIVGLGGLGKTTLAKLVYNDPVIVSNFEKRLWICVSEDFDLKKLVEKIMKDATGGVDHAHLDLNQLQACLRNTLELKKFLLVLDDVWNDDRKKWVDLRDLLICGSCDSKIIVTTRKESTAKIMGTFAPYKLKGLSEDECMSIFVKCAFREGEDEDYPKLVEIGKAIVMKCGGLPLAVRCLGSLLYAKREEHEWVYIRDNDIWKVEHKANDILPSLKLSYDEMPLELKQCFAYCARHSKDAVFHKFTLIEEWIAQGFLQSSDGSRELEDIGNLYFQELLSRSFFQDLIISFDGKDMWFKMHDLVHDLALFVAGKEILHVDINTTSTVSKRTRHVLLCEKDFRGKEFPNILLKLNKVHSFTFNFKVGPITKQFLDTLVKTFKCLRVLNLRGSEFEELPVSVGKLKHLRLLNIAQNKKIKELPQSISSLVNLQTLYVYGCVLLQDLPRDFGYLLSLRTLYLTSQMTCFPRKGLVNGFTSLQNLFICGCNYLESFSAGMENLTALRNLQIIDCPKLIYPPSQIIRCLTSLENLSIRNCEKLLLFKEEEDSQKTMELPSGLLSLELLEIPTLKQLPCGFAQSASTIKYIKIRGCPCFEILPMWLNECKSLSKLGIKNCLLLESLPPGMHQLAELRTLRIGNCSGELARKCESETGEYWPWISQIPDLRLN